MGDTRVTWLTVHLTFVDWTLAATTADTRAVDAEALRERSEVRVGAVEREMGEGRASCPPQQG